MNTRFSYNLLQFVTKKRPAGFALPLVIMTGTVLLVVGATMLVKGTNDQNQVISQKAKAVANSAAEAGMTRVKSTLAMNPAFAKYQMDEWANIITTYDADNSANIPALTEITSLLKQQSCDYATKTDAQVRTAVIASMRTMTGGALQPLPDPGSNPAMAPSYRVRAYNYYPDGTAKVHLLGQAGSAGNAKSNLVATIPVTSSQLTTPTTQFPGLWVKEYLRAGQNDNNPGTLNAHVAYDCAINAGTLTPTAITSGQANGYTKYVSSGTAGGGTAIRVAVAPGNPAPEKTQIPMPNPPTLASAPVTPIALNAISSNLTLPRPGDTSNYHAASGTYYYSATSISGNTTDLIFTPGQKVVLFLSGNVGIGGSAQITHNCDGVNNCDATNVQILGSTANVNGTFATSGNSAVCSVFLWAPTYTVAMNGGGHAGDCPSDANQNGIYWVKAWTGGGQGSHQALQQSGSNWDKIKSVVKFPVQDRIGQVTQWTSVDDAHTVTPPTSAQIAAITASRTGVSMTTDTTGTCTVPTLTTIALPDANSLSSVTSAIVSAGLSSGVATLNSASTTTGVLTQDPAAGTRLPCGSLVSFTYKLPVATACTVPNIVGSNTNSTDRIAAVAASVTNAGLVPVATSASGSPAKVLSQNPAAKTVVTCGTDVAYSYNR